jgi:hypothetical protein
MHTQRFIAYIYAVCLISLAAGPALADDESGDPNALLRGTYRFSVNIFCAEVQAGFIGPPGLPPLTANGEGHTRQIFITGVNTYDGNGHVMTIEEGTLFFPGPYFQGGPTALTFKERCRWSYTVNPDGSFTQEGSCTGVSEPYTLSGIKVRGQIGARGSVLIFHNEPVVQTLEVPPSFSTKRLCGSSGTAVRIRQE